LCFEQYKKLSKIENPLMGVCIEERPVMHWVSKAILFHTLLYYTPVAKLKKKLKGSQNA
jgi:hypothetical protein